MNSTAPRRASGRSGFTLVELLVVVGIIAVLIGILLPTLARARANAVKAQCLSNLRTLGQCLYSYVADNKGRGMFYSYNGLPAPAPYVSGNSFWFGFQAVDSSSNRVWLDPVENPGYLTKYYKNPAFLNCPAVKPDEEGIVKFNLSTLGANMPLTTYAYNGKAAAVVTNPASPDFGAGASSPAKCKVAAETVALVDAFTLTLASGALSFQATYNSQLPSAKAQDFHGRHAGFGNVLWYDGHVTSEAPYLLTPAEAGAVPASQAIFEMRYKQKLGFLTPYTRATVPPANLFVNSTTSNLNYYYWSDKQRKR